MLLMQRWNLAILLFDKVESFSHIGIDKENAVFHSDRSKECLNNMAILNKNDDHADSFIHNNYYHKLLQDQIIS